MNMPISLSRYTTIAIQTLSMACLTCSLQAAIVTVFPQAQDISAPDGLQFKADPALASRTTQLIGNATIFRAKAFLDTPEGRFFLSEKSYEQLAQGKTGYWAYITGVSNRILQRPVSTKTSWIQTTPEEEALGKELYEQARFVEAEVHFRKALVQQQAIYGAESNEIMEPLSWLADSLRVQGKLGELGPLLLQYERAIEKQRAPSSAAHSASVNQLIDFYQSIGDGDTSARWIEKYAKCFLEDGYPDSAESFFKPAARSHYARLFVGRAYMEVGRFQEAEKILSFALAGIRKVTKGGGDDSGYASGAQLSAQLAMADLDLALGKDQEALALIDEAVKTMRADAQKDANGREPVPASVLVTLGQLRLAKGEIELAARILQEAHSIMSRNKKADAFDRTSINVASAWGAIQFIRGNHEDALEQARRVAQLQKEGLSEILSFGSERQRLTFRETQRPYDLLAALQDGAALAETALQTKGIVLDSICEDQMIARETDNNRLLSDLKTARSELQFVRLKAESNDFKVTPAMLDVLRSRVESLEGELARQGRDVSGSRRAFKIGVEDVRHILTKNSVLIEFVRYGQVMPNGKLQPAYGAVVITSSGAPSFQHCGSSSDIDAKIASHRELSGQPLKQGETLSARDVALEKVCRELYAAVAAPIERALPAGTHELVLCPDGQLHFLAFAALLDEQGHFWSEKFTLRNVSTGRDLLKQPKKSEPGHVRDIVLVGDPDYRDDTPLRLAAQAAGQESAASPQNLVAMNLRGGLSNHVRGMDFVPLPGTAAEVSGLKTRFDAQGWKTRVLVGPTATESTLQSVRTPAILHLATHGFFLDELQVGGKSETRTGIGEASFTLRPTGPLRDPMLCSGLALSGAQSTMNLWSNGKVPPLDRDGILTASEAASLNLNGTFLVTLSACETGLGEARSGEGVLGLKRGFAVAGAENLLMTLWQISDDETVALMGAFYDRVLKGEHPARALPAVQTEFLVRLRKERGLFQAINLAGPFVLVGGTALP